MDRVHSIDYLKLLVACVVVLAHSGLFVGDVGALGYVLGAGLARAAVPVFAVVSGFLFYGTWRQGRARRWLIRLFLFYLAGLAFYLPIWLPEVPTAQAVALELIFGPMHMWYIAALFVAVFLLIGVLARVSDAGRARIVLLTLALAALVLGAVLQAVDFFTPVEFSMHVTRNGLFLHFPYVVLGFLLAERWQRCGSAGLPSHRQVGLALALLVALRLGEAMIYLSLYGSDLVFGPELPVLAAPLAVGLLLFALRLNLPEPRVSPSFLSIAVYFLHLFCMIVAMKFGIDGFAGLALAGIIGPIGIALAAVAMARLAAGRIPGLAALLGEARRG